MRVHIEGKQIKIWKYKVNQTVKDLGLHLILLILTDFEIRERKGSYWKKQETYITVTKKEFMKCGFLLTDDNRMERKLFIKYIVNDEYVRMVE